MPGTKSDGSITIDTKLDNSGFSKGSSELKHAVKSLTDQVNQTGNKLQNAFKFDFGQPKQAVNSFSRAIKQVNEEIADLGELGQKALEGDADALARFRSESGETLSKLEDMKAELEKFGSTEFATPEYAKASAEYEKAATQVDELATSLENAEAAFEKLTNDFGSSAEYEALEDRIEVLKMYQKEYDAAMKRGDGSAAAKLFMDSGVGKGTIKDAIKDAEAEMQKLWDKFENSSPYKNTQKEIDKITEKLEQAKTEAARYKEIMDATPASFEGYESTEYEKDQAALQKTIDKLLEYRQLVRKGTEDAGSVNAIQLDVVRQKMQRIIDIGTPMTNVLKKAFNVIIAGAKKAAVSLTGMVKNGIVSGFKKLGNAIANVGKHSKKSNASLGTGFKTMLKYGLGIRSLFVLFNKLRRALIDGFTALSQYDTELNRQIGSFKTSLTTLKNSFAAAFASIAKVVLPILTSLISSLTEAISKVGQLVAALTGKTSFMKAVTAQNNTAESADNASDSMKDETKSAKELQRTLAGFDDVEILQNKSKLDKGQTAGTSFVETPIDSNFADLANKIKEAWENADFTEIGRMIGEKLKNALESIPWGKIKATLRKIAKSIATLLNGFLETPGLFSVIGKTIAEGINSAFEFVESFISNFHWNSLGKAIKDLILGVLNNLDWDLIYKTMAELGSGIGIALEYALNDAGLWSKVFRAFANGIGALVSAIRAFLGAVHWEELGTNISNGLKEGMIAIPWGEIYALAGDFGTDLASFLNGLFTEDTFSVLGETVAEFINVALRFLNAFGETFDFSGFGKSLAAGLNSFFKKFNTLRLASGIVKLVIGIRDTIVSFLEGVSWYKFGAKIRDIIKNLPWKLILLSFGKVIWEAINASVEMFMGLFDTDNISSPFTSALSDLKETIDSAAEDIDFDTLSKGLESLVTALTPAISGFGAGLLEVFNGLLQIGIEFLNALGPAFQAIADAINSLPEGTVSKFGEDLGKIAGSLILMKGASSVLSTLGGLITKLTSFGSAGAAAAAGATQAAGGASAVGEAASGAAIGIGGLLSKLGMSAGATAVFQDALDKHVISWLDGSKEAALETDAAFGYVGTALEKAGIAGDFLALKMTDVTSPMFHLAYDDAPEFATAFGEVAQKFEDAGGDVGAFKNNLSQMLSEGVFNASQAQVIQDYIGDIGAEAADADTNTADFAGAFEQFNGLGWTTPLKMALISGAIKALGESGKLSKEDTGELYQLLDEYDANPTEENMKRISDAFEGTGVSADEFVFALVTSMQSMDKGTQKEIRQVLKTINNSGSDLKAGSEDTFEKIGEGAVKGMENKEKDISKEAGSIIDDDVLGTMDDHADSHSPSRETMSRGQYLIEGLMQGMKNLQTNVVSLTGIIIDAIITKIDSYKNAINMSGRSLMTELQNGMNSMSSSISSTASSIANSIQNSFNYPNWNTLGYNIGMGIYNGLVRTGNWLYTLAWNTAVDMYNAACRALGIASPSKEFKWIGEMMTAGLGEGVEATQDTAVDAVTSLADAVMQEAEGANPIMQIDTAVGGIDSVLSTFSDKVVQSFDAMISAMEDIVNGSSLTMPAVANGSVMPYSARRAASQDERDNLSSLIETLAQRDADRLTRDDLMEVLVNVCRQYLNIDFYIGDEQIARHANAGNAKLNRRYSAATT